MYSPNHPYSHTGFTINEKGADDIEKGVSKKNVVVEQEGGKTTSTTTDD
jgi:hypothetical protein